MAVPNTLFAIVNVADSASLEATLLHVEPWVHLKLDEGQWLLVAPSATTSKEVSDRLGFTEAEGKNGMVLRVETYFGREPRSTWEWITTKQGAELGLQIAS